jgi:diguanylate cyclase (GGDEF)-like protein
LSDVIERIRNASPFTRWSAVGLAFAVAMGICISAAVRDGDLLSAVFLFIAPAVLSALFFTGEVTAILSGSGVVLALVVFLPATDRPFVLLTTLLSIAFNAWFWSVWTRDHTLRSFSRQKTLDELDETMVSLQQTFEKTKGVYQANQIKIQRYWALNELARNLAMMFKTQEAAELLVETVSKTFMVPGAVYTLLLLESSMGKPLCIVRYSVDTLDSSRKHAERQSPDDPFNAWVSTHLRILFTNDAANDYHFSGFVKKGRKLGSIIAAPMMAGNEVLGIVRIESHLPGVFKQDEARLLSNFADLGAVALEHAALYRQTIELAITDGLTGLYVQRYYKERVRDEVLRALEYKLPLSLMMIDVDNFKTYNDRYGHLVGDQVLKSIAKVLKESVRAVDLVARYGGEEFSVLLPKTQWEGARVVAERVRKNVEEVRVTTGDLVTGVTVSIGVAEIQPRITTAEAFVDLADQALYQAKAKGKNCVVRATGSVS